MKSSLSRLTNFTNYESITDSFIDEHCRNNVSSTNQRKFGKFNFKRSFSCQYLTRALHELCEDPFRAQRNFMKPSASEIHNSLTPLPTPISSGHYHSTDNQLRTESSEVFVKGPKRSRILQSPKAFENFDNRRPPLSSHIGTKTRNDEVHPVQRVSSSSAQFDLVHYKNRKLINGISEHEVTPDNSYDDHTGIDIVPFENTTQQDFDKSNNINGDTEELHEFSRMSLRDLRQIFETVDSIMETARKKVETEFAYPWSDPLPRNEKNGTNEFASPILCFEKHDRYVQVYRFGEMCNADDADTSLDKTRKVGLKSLKRHIEEGICTLFVVILTILYFLAVVHFHLYLIMQRNEFWRSINVNDDNHRADQ